jgi:hypothetical protein
VIEVSRFPATQANLPDALRAADAGIVSSTSSAPLANNIIKSTVIDLSPNVILWFANRAYHCPTRQQAPSQYL